MTFIFRNKTIFQDISKQNRGQEKWDGGSTNHKINEIIECIKKLKGNIKQTRMNFKNWTINSLVSKSSGVKPERR